MTTNLTRQKNRLNASFSSEAKKLENKCFQKHSFNLGEALNRDRTSSKWPWSKVVWSASNICYLHSTWYFWWVPFWSQVFFFFYFEKLQFSLVPHWIFNFILTSLYTQCCIVGVFGISLFCGYIKLVKIIKIRVHLNCNKI